jgi:pimeloyl-ACP methyl ester carboxylesterase
MNGMKALLHRSRLVCALTASAALGSMISGCAQPMSMQSARSGSATKVGKSQTVVFIHGMYLTPVSWAKWEQYFQAKGYKTLAPAWPEHEKSVAEQRQGHPSQKLAALTLSDVMDAHRKLIRELPEKPILIGHSMGGLIVQILLQEGLGAAGVAIDSAPPKGIISLRYSFLKSNWPAIRPSAKIDEPILLSQEAFSYGFANCVSESEQKAAFEQLAVPESRRVGKGPTTDVATIDYARARPPLLLIAGGQDHSIPPSLNRSNYAKYEASGSITDFREFPERCHYTIGQRGWEEVADYAIDWLKSNQ